MTDIEGSSDTQTAEEAKATRDAALKQAQEAVEQLYWLNTHYFESHDVESAGRKDSDVREKMKETLSLLDTLQDLLPREQFAYLRGRTLNVVPEHSPEAETLLVSAVKRDPTLAGAWVSVGESYWKKGNIQQAHDCFTSSITHVGP
jgi:predicted Zn-dependent protease